MRPTPRLRDDSIKAVDEKKRGRGFTTMSPERLKEVSIKGGRESHRQGTAHEWTSEEARKAGRKGHMWTPEEARKASRKGVLSRRKT